ncbi:hypothetical protein IW261DRAFT_1659666 [Armillaria novae-zelandiae]|uniref:Heterokaryon incompatibility domain-containing protein n=1 Tax=Armillaria novae-zelandiae TaxID=153914 RepID=A0AA39U2M3_9AGAR|nr:hypothetical protein IW261DRAFT_1659666 [Armillaria novae-zelandiae]
MDHWDDDRNEENEWEIQIHESVEHPEVTISAFTEASREELSIVVPLQRAYTGRKPVIPSRLADTPCSTFNIQSLLDQLNTTLGTSYSLDNLFRASLLVECMTNEYDFGMAYGYLRRVWYTNDWSTIRDVLWRRQEDDRKERREALVGDRIVNPELPPRRVWDLYSNRVVPWWVRTMRPIYSYRQWPKPISHAWMDKKDRAAVWTPINGYEWPVPLPKDANLNLIRIEMLNLGLEYAWLDVLCLRQVGGRTEDLRTEEWKLDVPTIGRVYGFHDAVCYLSGLGRPLTLKEGDLESDQSWFRRAWTLQEVGDDSMVIAGDTPDGPLHAECKDGDYGTELLTRFHKQLQCTTRSFHGMQNALGEMRNRVSTNPLDKIAGLASLAWSGWIPAYYESASLEEAWTALVDSMHESCRAELFVLFPEPGDGGQKWRPSWDQVMTKPLLPYEISERVDRDETGDEDWCDVRRIEGFVWGLAVVEGGDRHGEFIVECDNGVKRFVIAAAHTCPIPEDTYTLIYYIYNELSTVCVVGRSLPGERFGKVSVVEAFDEDLLNITQEHRYILI